MIFWCKIILLYTYFFQQHSLNGVHLLEKARLFILFCYVAKSLPFTYKRI